MYISSLHIESHAIRTKQLSTAAILFIDSSHVGVSRRLLRSISLALYRLSIFLLLNRVFLTTVIYSPINLIQPNRFPT